MKKTRSLFAQINKAEPLEVLSDIDPESNINVLSVDFSKLGDNDGSHTLVVIRDKEGNEFKLFHK